MNKTGRLGEGSVQNSIWNLHTKRHVLWTNECTTNVPKGGTSGSTTTAPKIPKGAGQLLGRSMDRDQKRCCRTKVTQTDYPRSAAAIGGKIIFPQAEQMRIRGRNHEPARMAGRKWRNLNQSQQNLWDKELAKNPEEQKRCTNCSRHLRVPEATNQRIHKNRETTGRTHKEEGKQRIRMD